MNKYILIGASLNEVTDADFLINIVVLQLLF